MFIKNLQFAFRNFTKNKATTVIHILGLAVGISASIVIFLIVRYDFSFDKWEPKTEHTYRVYTQTGLFGTNKGISLPAADGIVKNITGIETYAHFLQFMLEKPTVTIPKGLNGHPKTFSKNDGVSFADGNYFKIFPHTWLAGNPKTALSELNQVVLSESNAKKYFPDYTYDQILGQEIIFEDTIITQISGIVADLKEHTDFNNSIFVSLKTFTETNLSKSFMSQDWRDVSGASQFFVRLKPNTNPAVAGKQIEKLFKRNQKDVEEKDLFIGKLEPLENIHFDINIDAKADKSVLLNLSLLAIFLLLLAAINFINLSTAQSTLRAKEIGIRKTFGGNNKQIIFQFLTETLLVTIAATGLAFLLSPFLIYIFRGFVPDGMNTKELFQPVIILFAFGIIGTVTLLAGIYPAFILTKYRPAVALKSQGISKGKSGSAWIRQILTVFQFVIAQVFLIAVIVIGKQIHFALNKDLGFKKNGIVTFKTPDHLPETSDKKSVLINELKNIPQIKNVSLNSAAPIKNGWSSTTVIWADKGEEIQFDNVHARTADENYLNVFGIQLLEGKNIQVDTSSKITDVLINESFLHQMGYNRPGQAIGQFINDGGTKIEQIVGVVKDFNTMNLYSPISPTVIFAGDDNWMQNVSVSFNITSTQDIQNTMARINKVYTSVFPNKEFEYSFFDDTIKDLYKSDIRLSKLLKWATGLAIFISSLGLLGLVSFMANQRTKEIGIRKVLGATITQTIVLLSKSLVKLVILASVIAFPIAWYFSHRWLMDFVYKTSLSWWIFFISGIGMLAVTLTVLCLRTFNAAKANPVDSLREE